MSRFAVLVTFIFWLSLLPKAHAGDPCPIAYHFYDAGVPSWLDRASVLDKLTSKATWLGVRFQRDNLPDGSFALLISRVHASSPAKQAGIKVGDLITAIDGKRMTSIADFDAVLSHVKDKQVVNFAVQRGDDGSTQRIAVKVTSADPLLKSFLLVNQDCAQIHTSRLSKTQRANLTPFLFTSQRGFRCKSAHAKLTKHPDYNDGDIVFIRGSRRVLISMVGHNTTCINSSDYDGRTLTKPRVNALFNRITKQYTQHRYANP